MALESTFQYPSDLNVNWPTIGDLVSQGDDHLRGIKNVIKTTFPNIDGPVTATDEELNTLIGATDNIQDQIDLIYSSNNNITVQDFLLQNAGVF